MAGENRQEATELIRSLIKIRNEIDKKQKQLSANISKQEVYSMTKNYYINANKYGNEDDWESLSDVLDKCGYTAEIRELNPKKESNEIGQERLKIVHLIESVSSRFQIDMTELEKEQE